MDKIAHIVRRAKNGDYRAFEELVRIYTDRIYSILLRILGHPQDAEDALQETFIRVFKGLGNLRDENQFGIWITKIAVNVARSLLKKKESHIDIEEVPEPVDTDVSVHPLDKLDREELKSRLEKTISELPVELKEPFVLRDIEGFSIKEISAILGISPSLVKVRAHRARLFLRKRLSHLLS